MLRRLWIVVALVTANACLASTLRVEQTLSPSVADLASIKSIEITTQSGEVLLRGTFSEATASSGKFSRVASLSRPDGGVQGGKAEIEIDRTNGLSEEEIVVNLDELPYPESCRIMADGRELTMFTTTPKGKVEFRLSRRVTLANGRD